MVLTKFLIHGFVLNAYFVLEQRVLIPSSLVLGGRKKGFCSTAITEQTKFYCGSKFWFHKFLEGYFGSLHLLGRSSVDVHIEIWFKQFHAAG